MTWAVAVARSRAPHADLCPAAHAQMNKRDSWRKFSFDKVWGKASDQAAIYEKSVSRMVKRLLDGFNSTVFAYGQTSSGKTHTMMGVLQNEKLEGITPRLIRHLFDSIGGEAGHTFAITLSYLEIYNEHVYDLLGKRKKKKDRRRGPHGEIQRESLKIRQLKKGFHVPDLSRHVIHKEEEMLSLIRKGARHRSTAATSQNAESSRSHSILVIYVEKGRLCNDGDGSEEIESGGIVAAKFNLVDLAGSERFQARDSKMQRESASINQSLTSLANVISALTGKKKAKYIPYRDSSLTMLLKDSLGGNACTLMLANINPCDRNVAETVSTLRYASRAKKIKNRVRANQNPKDALLTKLQAEISKLKAALAEKDKMIQVSEQPHEPTEEEKAEAKRHREFVEQVRRDLTERLHMATGAFISGGAERPLPAKPSPPMRRLSRAGSSMSLLSTTRSNLGSSGIFSLAPTPGPRGRSPGLTGTLRRSHQRSTSTLAGSLADTRGTMNSFDTERGRDLADILSSTDDVNVEINKRAIQKMKEMRKSKIQEKTRRLVLKAYIKHKEQAMENKVMSAEAKLKEMTDVMSQLKEDQRKLKADLDESHQDVESLRRELEEKSHDLTEARRAQSAFDAQLAQAKATLESTQVGLTRAQSDLETSQTEAKRLQGELKSKSESATALERAAKASQAALKVKEEEVARLSGELSSSAETIRGLQTIIADSKKKLQETRENVERLTSDVESKSKSLLELQQMVDALHRDIESREAENAESQRKLKASQDRATALETASNETKRELESTQERVAQLQTKVQSKTEAETDARRTIEENERSLRDAEAKLRQAEEAWGRERQELQRKVSDTQMRVKKAEEQVAKASSAQSAKLAAAERKATSEAEAKMAAIQKAKDAETASAALRTKLAALESELKESAAKMREAEANFKTSEAALQGCKSEAAEAKAEVERSATRLQTLETELRECNIKLEDSKAKLDETEAKFKASEAQVVEMKEKAERSSKRLQARDAEFKSIEAKLTVECREKEAQIAHAYESARSALAEADASREKISALEEELKKTAQVSAAIKAPNPTTGLPAARMVELQAYATFVNLYVGRDTMLYRRKLVPLDPHQPTDFLSKLKDGCVLAVVIHRAHPDVLDLRALNTAVELDAGEMKENLMLVAQSCRAIGVEVGPYAVEELFAGERNAEAVLNMVFGILKSSLLRRKVLMSHPELSDIKIDKRDRNEDIVAAWVDKQIGETKEGGGRAAQLRAALAQRFGRVETAATFAGGASNDVYTQGGFLPDVCLSFLFETELSDLSPKSEITSMVSERLGLLFAASVLLYCQEFELDARRRRVSAQIEAQDTHIAKLVEELTEKISKSGVDAGTAGALHKQLETFRKEIGKVGLPEPEERPPDESRDETAFRMWVSNLRTRQGYVQDLFQDCSSGVLLLSVLEKMNPGAVSWKKAYKKPKNKFQEIANCNLVVELCKGPDFCFNAATTSGSDINDADPKHIMGLLWQMMQFHMFSELKKVYEAKFGQVEAKRARRRSISARSAIDESKILQWSVKTVSSAVQERGGLPDKTTRLKELQQCAAVKGFDDKSLSNSFFLLLLLWAVDPRPIDWLVVSPGQTREERTSNARYAISVARKLGATVFLLPEDITEVNPKMLLSFVAATLGAMG